MVCSQKSVRNRNFFENAGHVSFSFCQTGSAETHTKPCKTSRQGTSIKRPAIYWDHAVRWGGVFVKLVQQRHTQNHAKPAHRVRRSSGQPFSGTTRSDGVGGFGLALAILVGLAKNNIANANPNPPTPSDRVVPVNGWPLDRRTLWAGFAGFCVCLC